MKRRCCIAEQVKGQTVKGEEEGDSDEMMLKGNEGAEGEETRRSRREAEKKKKKPNQKRRKMIPAWGDSSKQGDGSFHVLDTPLLLRESVTSEMCH